MLLFIAHVIHLISLHTRSRIFLLPLNVKVVLLRFILSGFRDFHYLLKSELPRVNNVQDYFLILYTPFMSGLNPMRNIHDAAAMLVQTNPNMINL